MSSITLTSVRDAMSTSTTTELPPAETTPYAEDLSPKVGPIPLAAFIPMCFFAPFFISSTLWLIYTYTIKRFLEKRRIASEDKNIDHEVSESRDVEMQVAGFVKAPPSARTKIRKEKGRLVLEPLQEERDSPGPSEPSPVGSPLRQEWKKFNFNHAL